MKRTLLRSFLLLICSLLPVFVSNAQSAIDVLNYQATISFDLPAHVLTGDATLRLRNVSGDALPSCTLHLRDLNISSVDAGGLPLVFSQSNGEAVVNFNAPVLPNDSISIRILYGGTATDEGGTQAWGGCFWGSTTYVMGVGFTAPYVSMMRHWLPSNDIPSDKATFDLTFDVPEGNVVAGTGLLQPVTNESGRAKFRWVENHQTATYLVTYAISNYAVVKSTWNGIPMEYYVGKSDSAKAVTYFTTVPGMMEAFTQAFGPYPFDKVGYCLTEIGCMEHQTMISYATSLFNSEAKAGVIAAHELAHQWWGDWVTPYDFREAWLSEGFARYSEAVYAEYLQGFTGYMQTARQFGSEYRTQTAPAEGVFPLYDFPRTPPSSNYPGTIYSKGGAVLAMLRQVVGDSAFFTGLKLFGTRNAYGNGTTSAFRQVMEEAYGQPLDWFFDEWVYKSGYPKYTVQRLLDAQDAPFRLRIKQTQDTTKYPLFRMPIRITVVKLTGDTARFLIENHAIASEDFTFPTILNKDVRSYQFDPPGLILKTVILQTVGVEHPATQDVQGFNLEQNYPNPMSAGSHGETVIPFTSATTQLITINLFDSLGRKVKNLADAKYNSGRHTVHLTPNGLSPGVYTVQMQAGNAVAVRNVVVTK